MCLWRGLTNGSSLRWRGRLFSLSLHIDAAAEVRTLGDGDAWRHDVTVDSTTVANLNLVGCRDIAVDLAEDDQRLCKHLRIDLAVGSDGQHMILELDLALNLAFDREILAPLQPRL